MTENPAPASSAIKSPHDERDILLGEVARVGEPFDWDKGYDAEAELAVAIGQPSFKVKTKDQNGSGSCGGQSDSYGGAVIAGISTKSYEEKSAKFTYAPIAYPGAGGSTGRDLSDRAIKVGWGAEALTPSYDNGNPPSEAFMARKQDITVEAVEHAAKSHALGYFLAQLDIDAFAMAIRDFKYLRIGVVGSNNGSWRTADPKPPKDAEARWYHWVAGLRAQKRKGKKAIGFRNSWGPQTGDDGIQWINEDWFKARLTNDPYGTIPLFEPRGYMWDPVPLPVGFHHTFNKDLQRGMVDPECVFLQKALRINGVFPAGVPYSETFGPATFGAVQKFQIKYAIAKAGDAGFGRCGPKTRAVLNGLYA